MNFAEMRTLLEYYVDDVVENDIALRLFNEGKNKMAVAVGAAFPDITAIAPGDEFMFDARFHETPVLYAAAMVKAYDSSITEKGDFMSQFMAGVRDFTKEYRVPIQYTVADDVEHFGVGSPEGQSDFYITNPGYSSYGDIEVYVDSRAVGFQKSGRSVYLTDPAPAGSVVTVRWAPDIFAAPSYMKGW